MRTERAAPLILDIDRRQASGHVVEHIDHTAMTIVV